MTPGFASRRRAHDFDRLLAGHDDELARTSDPELAELAELVGALRAQPTPPARPAFVADLRERLMAEADTSLAPAAAARAEQRLDAAARLTVTPRRKGRDRRIAWALGGFAVVTATTSMAVASQGSLPGDALYPLKRSIEDARVHFAGNPDDQASLLLSQARERLAEVQELTASGDTAQVPATLQAYTDEATRAGGLVLDDYETTGDTDEIATLRDFTSDSLGQLDALDGLVPDAARPDLVEAAQTAAQLDGAAYYACSVGCGPPLTDLPALVNAALGPQSADLTPADLRGLGLNGKKDKTGDDDGRGGQTGGDDKGSRPDDPVLPDPPDLSGGNGGGSGGTGNGGSDGGGSGGTGNGGGLVGGIVGGVGGLLGGGHQGSGSGGSGSGGHQGSGGGLVGGIVGGLLGGGN